MRIRWYSCVQVDKITFIRGNTDPALCCGSNAAYCLSSCSKVLAEALAIAYWSFTHAANQLDDRVVGETFLTPGELLEFLF